MNGIHNMPFMSVPDKDPRSLCEPDYFPNAPPDPSDEECELPLTDFKV